MLVLEAQWSNDGLPPPPCARRLLLLHCELLERRGNPLLADPIDLLREAVRRSRPFSIDAWVVLPDHLHAVWTLPAGDDDLSTGWRLIKTFFVRDLPKTERLSRVRRDDGERGIWQRRFGSTPSATKA